MERLAGHPWERVDELIEYVRRGAVLEQTIPESVVVIYHDDGLSGIVFTPTLLAETVDEVTDVLCQLVPRLHARGVAVIWPAKYELEGEDGEEWAMKVHRWDADEPQRLRTEIWPLPILGSPDGAPIETDLPDRWTDRLARAFCRPGPPLVDLGVVDAAMSGSGYELAVVPGGALDTRVLPSLN